MKFLGLQITRQEPNNLKSFVEPENDDSAIEVAAVGSMSGTYLDLSGQAKTEADLVTRYRTMERDPIVKKAIDDIVNESIVVSESEPMVSIVLNDISLTNSVKRKIEDEFEECLNLLNFRLKGYEIFQRWYVDGRLRYHCVIDETKPNLGVQELRYIDPRKIRKIREVKRGKLAAGIDGTSKEIKNEYYVYNEKGFASQKMTNPSDPYNQDIKGIRIAKDSIIDINSGIFTEDNSLVLSYLDTAGKTLNQLNSLEDASVIYRLSRAPERRIFYIDVGDLPKAKAEQYIKDMMTRHKNKLVYDASTGEIRDDRKFMTMLEDFWFPRREGGRGTEVTQLAGAQNLGETDDIDYFRKKLNDSLNVPSSRMDPNAVFSFGKSGEITRDEIKFAKFIMRLRTKFAELFTEFLEKQVVLKNIMTYEEWLEIRNLIRYDYLEDNHYQELKKIEILNGRLEALRNIQDYVGVYFSKDWVKTHILMLTDTEIEDMNKEIEAAKAVEAPPVADGDANDDGFADRHGKSINNSYTHKSGNFISEALNIKYVKEPTLEESIDSYLKEKLKLDDES